MPLINIIIIKSLGKKEKKKDQARVHMSRKLLRVVALICNNKIIITNKIIRNN